MLDPQKLKRYASQTAIPEIGVSGQERLENGRVLVVGVGGLGSPAGYYLAASGVGTIGLLDGDVVELGNLQRQIAYTSSDVGKPKVVSARGAFNALNPGLRIITHNTRITSDNATGFIGNYDFVIDATDTLESKFIVADACYALGKPSSHAAVSGFGGYFMTVFPGKTACLRCLFSGFDPVSGDESHGVLGPVAGVAGIMQAAEAIKHLLGVGSLLTDCIMVYDALVPEFRRVNIKPSPECRLCGVNNSVVGYRKKEECG